MGQLKIQGVQLNQLDRQEPGYLYALLSSS